MLLFAGMLGMLAVGAAAFVGLDSEIDHLEPEANDAPEAEETQESGATIDIATFLNGGMLEAPAETDSCDGTDEATDQDVTEDDTGDDWTISTGGEAGDTVTGTDGKGSTCAFLAALLQDQGRRVGVYSSPHLLRYNERIRVNAEEISDEAIVASFEAVERHRKGVSLTYFEFGTLAALQHFSGQSLDYLILEVGLGGRLDAVNIIEPQLTVVTSIDLDHQAWLGDSRESIGREKAGIFRRGVAAVCGDADPPESVLQTARELDAPLFVYGRDFGLTRSAERALHWQGRSLDGQHLELQTAQSPVLLDSNVATALQALALLPNTGVQDYAALESGVSGRQERIEFDGIDIILDVSHNPAAARALAAYLSDLPAVDRCCALFAVMADKDIEGMVSALKARFDAWFLGDLTDNARAKPARDLAPMLHEQGIHMISVSKNMRQAFARAVSLLEPGQRLVVFGSVFTVAEVKSILGRKRSRRSLEGES